MDFRRAVGSASTVLLVVIAMGASRLTHRPPAANMSMAASDYLGSLSPELRSRALLAFDGKERTDWHFVPRTRPGVTFGEMNDAQRAAARGLVRSALSAQGMLKVESIMGLDAVLHDMEKAAGGTGAGRDPLGYVVTVYGDPSTAPWGWKIEGHHVSLNFTIAKDDRVSVTPSFLGANPGEIRSGPKAGVRVLAIEEDLGRALVQSLDGAQRAEAVISSDAPADVLSVPGRNLDSAPPAGLAYSRMTETQQATLRSLLREYVENLSGELAEGEHQRIEKAGLGDIRFAWAGSLEKRKPHYYRISGPTFVIEYDNTQNDANHVHTLWHDRERDFGRDLLREHLELQHGQGKQ